ncbi:hypothetical protein ACHAWF_004455 [Thalassiosira exigua]
METRLQEHLDRRRREGTLRSLMPLPKVTDEPSAKPASSPAIDFASNDYLGLARCRNQHDLVQLEYHRSFHSVSQQPLLGATGSRLLSGDSNLARSLEAKLARFHNRPAALLFNSGYDANLSILSSLPYSGGDAMVMDELVHNSLIMGVRMGRLKENRLFFFKHNNVADLKRVLDEVASSSSTPSTILIVVESVYSMDGDISPLTEILELARSTGAAVMVDEAHGLGIFGRTNGQSLELTTDGNIALFDRSHCKIRDNAEVSRKGGTGVLAALDIERHPALLCSVHTFGKAAGCHGAVVAGSPTLMSFLVNYARPFVYSTALPPHSLVSIEKAYESMMGSVGESRRKTVFRLVRQFRDEMSKGIGAIKEVYPHCDFELIPSPSPIQAVIVPGNERCILVCQHLRESGKFDVYPIRSPTCPKGKERIRIILHSHNSTDEIRALSNMLLMSLRQLMMLPNHLKPRSKM